MASESDNFTHHFLTTAQEDTLLDALKQSEAHLAALFTQAHVGLSEISVEGKFLRVNDTLCKILNRSKEELLTLGVADVTLDEDIPNSLAALKQLQITGDPVSLDKRYISPNGAVVWANSSLSLIKSQENKLTIIAVTVDLSERKKTEEALRESENRFRSLVESYAQATWETGPEGRVLKDSPSWRKYTGQTIEEWFTNGWVNAIYPVDKESAERQWKEAIASKSYLNIEQKIKFETYGYRWTNIRATPIFDKAGNILKWIGMIIDIHSQKVAEQQIKEFNELLEHQVEERTWEVKQSKAKFEAAINVSPVVLSILKSIRNNNNEIIDFYFDWVSKSGEWLVGKDVTGKLLLTEFPYLFDVGAFQKFLTTVETGEPTDYEALYQTEFIYMWVRWKAVKLEDGLFASVEDITKRKNAELALKESKALQEAIFHTVRHSIVVLTAIRDKKNKIVDFEYTLSNGALERLLGMEVMGETFRTLETAYLNEGIYKLLVRTVESGKPSETIIHLSQHNRPIYLYTQLNRLGDCAVVVFENITSRMKEEMLLKESKNLLQSIFDTSLIQMSVLKAVRDEAGNLVDFEIKIVNKELEKETGRNDLVGKLYVAEYPGIKAVGLFDAMAEVLETGKPKQVEYFYPFEGFNKWFSCMFVKMEDGLVATNLDISERKKAELDLQEQKYFVDKLALTTPDNLYVIDIYTLKVIYANRTFAEVLGYSAAQRTQMKNQFLDVVHPEDLRMYLDHINSMQSAADKEVRTLEYRVVDVAGNIRWMNDRDAVFRRDSEGRVIEKIGVTNEITFRIKAEQELVNLKLNQQKQILDAVLETQEEERKNIAESLHNGLGQLLYALKMRIEFLAVDHSLEQHLLKNTIDDLLEEAINQTRNISLQLTPHLLESFGLKHALGVVVENFNSDTLYINYKINTHLDRFDPDIEIAVFRIVQELINNIVKHSKAGVASIRIESNEEIMTITVKDDGVGFNKEELKTKRTGFGMRMIENRVKLMNGTMKIESSDDAGTKTTISLDIKP